MRLVVTGGGTGGHVFPALEVAQAARGQGWSVEYFGSNRGIEGKASEGAGLPFRGFASEPVYRPFSPRGVRSVLRLLKASAAASEALVQTRPDVLFSTGGYASAPVVRAARRLGIPYVLHEQNTVPGRSNRLMAPGAKRVCTVFETSERWFPRGLVVRTGMPIRRELRDSAQGRLTSSHGLNRPVPIVLVMGGSQGSAALNDVALATAVRMARSEVQWLHLTGLGHFESTSASLSKMAVRSDYAIKAYLDADEMAEALFSCTMALCRSGAGTLSELAAFRKPAILVPYPQSFGDHQTANAREFAAMGAADLLPQGDLAAASVEARIHAWLTDAERLREAEAALARWDVPDSTERILRVLEEAKA
jgi:UDP-N-acetylglucosamine--N-acetylmuramyl-(pentapeptide) pyrophosphoryl-undecaprenol N-acetylglucosamine transferase